jgi:hypothetical protein
VLTTLVQTVSVIESGLDGNPGDLRRRVAEVHLEEGGIGGELGSGGGGLFESDQRSRPNGRDVGVEQSPQRRLIQLEEPGLEIL